MGHKSDARLPACDFTTVIVAARSCALRCRASSLMRLILTSCLCGPQTTGSAQKQGDGVHIAYQKALMEKAVQNDAGGSSGRLKY